MQKSSTAIRRLADLLHTIAPKMQDGRAFSDMIAPELGIDPKDVLSLQKVYTGILELFDSAIEESESISDETQRKLFVEPIQELKTIFHDRTVRSPANSFGVAEPTLSRLRYAAEFVSFTVEQPVDQDVLSELRASAEAMVAQIIESNLPKYLKGRLVELLEKFRFAIITYRVQGISGLRKASEEMMGALVVNKAEVVQATNKDAANKKTIFDLVSFIERASKIVEFASKVKELAAPVINWLLPGGNNTLLGP